MTSDSSKTDDRQPGDFFPTTRWTVVLTASRPDSPEAATALEELCRTYWFPLYGYVRRQGHGKEDAEDLVQSFFARFLDKNYLDGLSSEKGRLRAFLLAALKHFLANEWDSAKRQKRGGQFAHLSLDWSTADSRYRLEPSDRLSPDRIYDRQWAITLLERVIGQLREECTRDNKGELFEHLKPLLTIGKKAIPHSQVARNLRMSEEAVRVAVHRLRQRYRQLLRDEIAQTLADPAQVEDELRSLFQAFEGG